MPQVVFERALVCNNSIQLSKRGNEYSPFTWLDIAEGESQVFQSYQFDDSSLGIVKEMMPTTIYRLVFNVVSRSESIGLELAEARPVARIEW